MKAPRLYVLYNSHSRGAIHRECPSTASFGRGILTNEFFRTHKPTKTHLRICMRIANLSEIVNDKYVCNSVIEDRNYDFNLVAQRNTFGTNKLLISIYSTSIDLHKYVRINEIVRNIT